MTEIKICGITTERDIEITRGLDVDYIGFVFVERSTRYITVEEAGILAKQAGTGYKKAGVFVNWPVEKIKNAVKYCGLDVVQLHGNEPPEVCRQFDIQLWKAVRVRDVNSLSAVGSYYNDVDGFVFDCFLEYSEGGTGQIFDWGLMEGLSIDKKVILAGGLNSHNIHEAIKRVRPDCVDVSTGVESRGKKDEEKIIKFIRRVKSYEERSCSC